MEKIRQTGQRKEAREQAELFCRTWFEQRDAEAAASFLADNVSFIGVGEQVHIKGRDKMEAYLREDIREMQEPFACGLAVLDEELVSENACHLSVEMCLKNSLYTWYLRGFILLLCRQGFWQIRSLHFAQPSVTQQKDEHYPKTLVMENIARRHQEILNDSLAGGMMGSYLDEGFPFYFVNRPMLDYLGYADEEEFVTDIGGKILHCMHPDDREMVNETVRRQIKDSGDYAVEYRMKKKDGNYIWVHDIGRVVAAENRQPAIASVCVDITAQRNDRNEILHLYNNIPGGVFRCRFDVDFPVIDANDGLFEFLGYSREEFAALGNKMSAVMHPDDLAVLTDRLNEQLIYGNTIKNENRFLCKDGSIKWVSVKGHLFEAPNGERHFYCVLVDITEEKRLQERINELYEQEMTYFAELSSKDGTFQGRINVTQNKIESYISTANVAVARLGDTYDQTVENLADSSVNPDYGKDMMNTLEREKVLADYGAGKVDYHFTFMRRRKDGTAFWSRSNFRTCLNPATGDVIMFFYTLDITEQKLQEELLKKVTRLDYDIITEIDIQTSGYRLVGFSDGWNPSIPLQGDFQQEIRRVALRCMDERGKEKFLNKLDFEYMKQQLAEHGSYTFILKLWDEQVPRMKRFQVFYISEELGRVCMTRADVTDVVEQERKQREDMSSALMAAEQANAAKTDFLSRMSHEIRTPMNAIIGMTAIAVQANHDNTQVADCLSKIGISSRFLLSLINDILDMSRIESGKMLLKNEKIPTEEFVNGINAICFSQAEAKGVTYECIVDPVLDDYYVGDAMKLQQVLVNIIENAIKFTPEGGTVTFSVEQCRRSRKGAELRFVVNDTGVGMNEEFLPHIFEPFSQESTGTTALYGGTGLGLAISKNIVDLMDGHIGVRSIKGIGTEFTVVARLGITEEALLQSRKKAQIHNFAHLKTLVVDDDVAACISVVATLKEIGITGEWVDSGSKAVKRVEELWSENKYYDMVLIDWKMPGMNGIETARKIRTIVGPDVTIIIMTAYDWSVIEHEAKLAGVNLLVSKPMFRSSLISAFSKTLGEKEEEQKKNTTPAYDFTGRRVLLVEDNALNTEVAMMLLESRGLMVETAENGLRAMEMFAKTEKGHYAAILMDIRMPVMDGLTAARNIRNLSNPDAGEIPIIAMTANAFDEDIEKSKAAGMNAHLEKPIDPNRLYQTLHHFIIGKEE